MSTREERQRRRFSEQIKQEVVKRIDRGEQSVSSARRELEVSFTTIYRWLSKYSVTYRKQLHIDYLEKLITIAESEQGVDIRKKAEFQPSSGSVNTDQNARGQ